MRTMMDVLLVVCIVAGVAAASQHVFGAKTVSSISGTAVECAIPREVNGPWHAARIPEFAASPHARPEEVAPWARTLKLVRM